MKDIRSVKVCRCVQCGAGLMLGALVKPAEDDPKKPICFACLVRDNYEATHKLSYDGSMIRNGRKSEDS